MVHLLQTFNRTPKVDRGPVDDSKHRVYEISSLGLPSISMVRIRGSHLLGILCIGESGKEVGNQRRGGPVNGTQLLQTPNK